MKAKKIMPCGWQLTGVLKEHWAHYESCGDPACQGRHEETLKLKAMFQKAIKVRLPNPKEVAR